MKILCKVNRLFLITFSILIWVKCQPNKLTRIDLIPDQGILITDQIQAAIDSCSINGVEIVYFPTGLYLTGGLKLRSNVTLKLEKGAILQGSNNYLDYGNGKWTDGLITGDHLKNIAIIGEGVIDGVDCKNPNGEEGFRGPHCIRLTHCDSITIRDITITRSANWAQNFRHCANGLVENVTVRGGHDAFHTRWCRNFTVRNCDFRTGDDCFAGNDNQDFLIENCKANTSCNAFRFGCQNLTIRDCYIWGPGEYKHLSQNRNNTISAFTHFSPPDENPVSINGNWKVENVTIEGVDNVFIYNYEFGLWQTGQPATDFVFDNLVARNVKKSFTIIGDSAKQFSLTLKNSILEENDSTHFSLTKIGGKPTPMPAFFNCASFESLILNNVIINHNGYTPPIHCKNGQKVDTLGLKIISNKGKQRPVFEEIGKINQEI